MEKVIVAVDDKYNENNGAWQIAWVWDGEKCYTTGGMYDDEYYSVNATQEQIKAAGDWLKENTKATIPFNNYCYQMRGAHTYIGCIVKLKRSRKAPNGTPLKVVDFLESHYNARFNNHVAERVEVTDGDNSWIVSSSCIDEVVKGVVELPFWVK